MDVPSNNNKTLDGFYNDLRRKYPDAFTLVKDLGRRNGSLQKLPRLEKAPSPIPGILPNSPNVASSQRWSPDSFLTKVKYQKTRNEQRIEDKIPQQNGNAVTIKGQTIPVPTWTRKDYLEAQNGASFHLPNLRAQIEQNKTELKNRFNPTKKTETNQSSTLQTNNSVQAKTTSDHNPTKISGDHTTTKTTNDYTTAKAIKDYNTTQTIRDYTTTKPTKDYTTLQTIRDYTTTKPTKDYTTQATRDYNTTMTTNEHITTKPTNDYTTTQATRDYNSTMTSNDYTTTKPTKDYTTPQTIRDYTTTKPTNDYTTQATRDYNTTMTTNDYTTTKPTKDYTTPQTIRDYTTTKPTTDYPTTQATRDYKSTMTSNDYTTTKPTKDFTTPQIIRDDTTTKNYIIIKTTNDYTTTKSTKDYTTPQATRDYNRTRTKDYTTTKPTNLYNTTEPTMDYTTSQTTRDYTSTKTTKGSSTSQINASRAKSDPLGTIMKELLPNKPSQLMKDLPKTTNRSSNQGGCVSDSDSGVSVCSPMKVFRSKIRSPQAPPASRDIIKKFSAKPKRTSEPLKADHSLARENITQIVKIEDNPVTRYSKSSINFIEKIPQGPPRSRVHFEDESKEDAEFRYHERCLLERTQTTKISTNISPGPQIKYMEGSAKSLTTGRSSPSMEGERPKSSGPLTVTLPHRRQPFPPNVAKTVLIDIPRGGLPCRRVPHIRVSPGMRDITNKQFSPRNVTSLDGITMSFRNSNHEWGEQTQSITAIKEDERGHHSLSSLETLESGTTEVSSELTIMQMEWRDSSSSVGSGDQSRSSSQNRELNLDRTSQNKEISFYSKVRRSLRLKKKLSSEATSGNRHSDFVPKNSKDLGDQSSYLPLQIEGGVHGKTSPHGAVPRRLPNQTAANDSTPSSAGVNRTKKDVMWAVETQGTERPHPVKASYSPMRMMQSLLKKGRAKDYLVRVPSPPPQEARPPTYNVRPGIYRRGQIPDQASGRVLAIQPDFCRLVELERPKMGFSGLYLTKKNQHGYSGLYVVQLSGAFTSSFPQGILEVGDEILEINRLQAKDLRLDEIYTLLEESSCVLLRVSRTVSSSS